MIKAMGRTGDGQPLVLLGLSGENVTRLMADEPIKVDLAQMGGPPILILLVGGRTEDEITRRLVDAGLLPPEALKMTGEWG